MGEQITNQQPVYPLAPESKIPKSDEESNTLLSNELRRKKRIKLAIYIAAFVVFQTIVILIFSLIVMKVKTPKVRLGTIELRKVTTTAGTQASSPSFDISFTTQVRVKNTNFGPYKYDSSNATFLYRGVTVGEIFIPKGKAGMLSTKKVSVIVSVNSNALTSTTSLGNELGTGTLTLNSQAKLSGKVVLMFVMKNKKSAQMNCTISIKLNADNAVDLNCK
ncbi:hypothetical protein I3760_11G125400 [Carya illinoinensis]|uniref:Late embryogenesis abundant protein LEA-2 subgroup domain-containing protein n=1 Tax=Carya illinoinensis TaxID=32201 RepID=A0A8T1P5K0_CARIL|nr:uncharacterized protein LOC122282585 [Carya illinoinensis]KAG2681025.1 hypothetical protein I3760_11G125400 [Carya illinoinensis]KAG6636692.1 hypothetical protein CIPAW_11G128600 [Carya illinoinensis]KAG6688487.1 hypothetical protein I3842_11G127300 [Carya illinoinensis]